ncbi:MAG: hypothetical protein NT159_02325 [Proteobacteria bacterium]|nr:hypothetical protein [Pseudomonadota bacterium]
MQLPITVKLQPSRNLALLLVAVHFGALLVVGSVELPVWIKLVLLLPIVLSLWIGLHHLYGARRIVLLTLRDKGVVEYLRLNEETGETSIHLQSTVSPLLTVILLRQSSGLETLVLLPDSLSQDDYRRLRLWLRWRTTTN